MNHEIYGHSTDLPWGFRFIDNLHRMENGGGALFLQLRAIRRNCMRPLVIW